MIQVSINNIAAPYSGASLGIDVTYENTNYGGISSPSGPAWVTIGDIGGAQYGSDFMVSYSITVQANDSTMRSGTIVFQCTDTSGNAYTQNVSIVQGSGVVVYGAIWTDKYYYAPNVSVFPYSIRTGGVSIYFGKAYCRPGDGGCYVQVNKICQNYMRNTLPDFREYDNNVVQNVDAVKDFALCNEDGVDVVNYRLLYDWAGPWYGDPHYIMSEPINGHIDPRMKLMYTEYNNDQNEVEYEIND